MPRDAHSVRLHIVRPLQGAHDWWLDGSRLRDECRALAGRSTIVSTWLVDSGADLVHGWAAAWFRGELDEIMKLSASWSVAAEANVGPGASLWTEVVTGPGGHVDRALLRGLPGYGQSSTLALPIEEYEVLSSSGRATAVRLRCWSTGDEISHVKARIDGTHGLALTVHQLRGPLQDAELEPLALKALDIDTEVSAGLPIERLTDVTSGDTIPRTSDLKGQRVKPEGPLRILAAKQP